MSDNETLLLLYFVFFGFLIVLFLKRDQGSEEALPPHFKETTDALAGYEAFLRNPKEGVSTVNRCKVEREIEHLVRVCLDDRQARPRNKTAKAKLEDAVWLQLQIEKVVLPKLHEEYLRYARERELRQMAEYEAQMKRKDEEAKARQAERQRQLELERQQAAEETALEEFRYRLAVLEGITDDEEIRRRFNVERHRIGGPNGGRPGPIPAP